MQVVYIDNGKRCIREVDPRENPEVRKGEIALAYLKRQVLREGIKVQPQEIRSELGNVVKELNQQNPGLGITLEEALELCEEFVQMASKATFRPKNPARMGLRRPVAEADRSDPHYDTEAGHHRYDK